MIAALPVGRRLALSVAALAVGITMILLVSVPGAFGAYTARVTNSANAVSSNQYFTCTQASTGLGAALAWPLDDSGVLNLGLSPARDVSGNARAGQYTLGGVTYRQTATACPRDLTAGASYSVTLDGSSGYVRYGTTFALTNVFSESIWFKTSTTAGGRLIGFGDAATGASGQYDRMIYMTNAGTLVFGVYPGAVKTVTSPLAYNDNRWHHVVATLGAATGMQLYVDGKVVNSDTTTTTAQTYTPTNAGYLRVGYDNLNGWTSVPTSFYFAGSVRFADYFTSTLTATQVAALYATGTGS